MAVHGEERENGAHDVVTEEDEAGPAEGGHVAGEMGTGVHGAEHRVADCELGEENPGEDGGRDGTQVFSEGGDDRGVVFVEEVVELLVDGVEVDHRVQRQESRKLEKEVWVADDSLVDAEALGAGAGLIGDDLAAVVRAADELGRGDAFGYLGRRDVAAGGGSEKVDGATAAGGVEHGTFALGWDLGIEHGGVGSSGSSNDASCSRSQWGGRVAFAGVRGRRWRRRRGQLGEALVIGVLHGDILHIVRHDAGQEQCRD